MPNPRLIEIAKRLGKNTVPDLPIEDIPSIPGDFSLEDLTDSWRFSNISYRNNICTVDLFKELLPKRTQDQHSEAAVEAERNNEFHFPSYPLQHSIFSALEQNKDNPKFKERIGEAREFIKNSALKSWLMTSTRIIYNPKNQKDIVIHNYKQPDQYSLELDSFIGPDCYITGKEAVNVESPLRALLDTNQSVQEINSVYKWLTDVNAYLFRVNSERQEKDECVARFYADSDGDLNCFGDSRDSDPAFGVKFARRARAVK